MFRQRQGFISRNGGRRRRCYPGALHLPIMYWRLVVWTLGAISRFGSNLVSRFSPQLEELVRVCNGNRRIGESRSPISNCRFFGPEKRRRKSSGGRYIYLQSDRANSPSSGKESGRLLVWAVSKKAEKQLVSLPIQRSISLPSKWFAAPKVAQRVRVEVRVRWPKFMLPQSGTSLLYLYYIVLCYINAASET